MISEIPYPYNKKDRLEDRNTYFYSDYYGPAFLSAWRSCRKASLSLLPHAKKPSAQKYENSLKTSESIRTAELMTEILLAAPENPHHRQLAERLLQRFEVSKRLYRSYDLNFRAIGDSGYDFIDLYILFSLICLHYKEQPAALPFLNGLLKCLDTLTSVQNRLSSEQGSNLAWLIEAEENWVMRIANQVGVEI